MIRFIIIILFLVCSIADSRASDSTSTKPKKFFIDINGGMTGLILNRPKPLSVESGPNKSYDLRGGYSFQGNFFYQPRAYNAIIGYNLFCGIGFGITNLIFNENLGYVNHATSKFQSLYYSPRTIKTNITNEQISFCVGLRKTRKRINVSHKLGCFYSFAANKNFTNIYTRHEDGSYLVNSTTMVSYSNDYTITDNFTFKESICPYYGFDLGFGKKMLQPHLGFETIYFTNDIVVQSSESNLPVLAFGRALMVKFYLGLNFGF